MNSRTTCESNLERLPLSTLAVKVSLTALQIGEIAHKLQIVAEEEDLRDSYEISLVDAQAIADLFMRAKPGVVAFDAHLRDTVIGELENRMEALHCNWKDLGVESDGGIYRSLHQAVRLIKEASPGTITPYP